MFRASLHLINPWFKEDGSFKNLFCSERAITEHKSYCFEVTRYGRDLLEVIVDLSWRGQDHAGPDFTFALLTYSIHFQIYDNRHWNYETNKWYTKAELELENANVENAEKDIL